MLPWGAVTKPVATSSTTPPNQGPLREKVRELSSVSRDIELLTRQVAAAQSTMQVGFLNERIDALTVDQRRLVEEVTALCPESETKTGFLVLDEKLESVRRQVKECKSTTRLEELRVEIDPIVEEWAAVFQQVVTDALNPPVSQPEA